MGKRLIDDHVRSKYYELTNCLVCVKMWNREQIRKHERDINNNTDYSIHALCDANALCGMAVIPCNLTGSVLDAFLSEFFKLFDYGVIFGFDVYSTKPKDLGFLDDSDFLDPKFQYSIAWQYTRWILKPRKSFAFNSKFVLPDKSETIQES